MESFQDHEGEEEEDVIESRQTLKAGGLDGGLDEAELQAPLSWQSIVKIFNKHLV